MPTERQWRREQTLRKYEKELEINDFPKHAR